MKKKILAALVAAVLVGAQAEGASATVAKFVDWIGSTGAQRINTGVVPGKGLVIETDYIAGDYAPYVRQESKALFGTGWNEYLLEQREGLGFRASSKKTNFTKPAESDECTFTLAKDGALRFVVNGNVNTEATINAAYTGSSPIYLFGAGNVNNYNSTFKLRRFALAKDGVALRYLVPCVDTEERPGLFDTVSGTILYDVNDSATMFTVPEEDSTRTDVRLNGGTVQVAVTASAASGATVTGPTGWVALGSTLTFAVQVPDGQHFFKWTDAAGNSYYDNPHVVTVNTPIDLTLTPHFGTARYVEYSDSFDDFGDGSAGSPYSSINYALTQVSNGDTLLLKTGTYLCKADAVVDKGVTITSATGDRKDVILKLSGDNSHRVMRLNHPDARLTCVTINGDNKQATVSGTGVYIDALGGTVDHCEIFNCKSYAYGHVGGGIYIAADSPALVDSVIISNCTSHCEGPYGGAALFMTSADAKVVNSLFLKNTIQSSLVACGAVKIEAGLLKNCTIALNHIAQCSGVWATGGRVVDCIIAENTHPTALDAKSVTWAGTASCFSNCVGTAKINDFCFEEAHPFRDVANYDFTPVPSSVAVDGATAEACLGTTDFVGNSRIMGAAPDIGAVEMDPTELSASFAVDVDAGFAPLDAKFTVAATGIDAANLACLWDWNGDGTVDETTYGLTASHQFAACFVSVGLTVSNTVTGATYAVPVKVAIKSVGETVYVRKENETPVAPYDTWEKAATTLSDALAVAIGGCTVVLSNGTHQATAESILSSAVKVRGLTGDPDDVTVSAKSSGYRLFQLANSGAEVSGLTITGSSYGGNGGGVFINTDGGTVSNCLVRNCGCSGYGQSGGGIYIAASDAALVDSVVITNCKAYCEGGSGGNAICMAGGTVRNSLFMYNTPRNIISNSGGTVKITGGRLVNCTIALNSAAYRPGVWASSDGKVVSCIIAENTMTTGTDPLDQAWTGTASCFENCVASKYINDDCFTEVHPFTAVEVLDLTPSAKSAAFNGAELEPWMVGALDIMGNPRVSGLKPDIGAVEADANKFFAEFEADASEGFSPVTVHYTVSANGASAEDVACYWDWDGDGVYDEMTEGLTKSHDFVDCAAEVGLLASNKTTGATYIVPSKAAVKSVERTLYVVTENANAKVPYASWETAAASLNAAAELSIGGCTIIVSNGTHDVTEEIFIEKAVKVRGVTGDPDDVTLKAKGTGFRMFHLKDAAAEISGVTITGAKSKSNGAGVYFEKDGGTVSNAVIANCSCTQYNGVGAGIYIVASSAALVDSVVITNCDGYCEGSGGTALCMAGGTVRNSLFMYNTPNHCDSGSGGTVKITGGRLANCTIALNRAAYRPGVVASGDGRVVNCIIAGNERINAVDPLDQTWTGTASCFENCVASIYINDSCHVEVEPFADINALDLSPAVKSKAFNGAEAEAWMTGAKDILGNPRVVGGAPDIGAVESQVAEFSVDFNVTGEASGFAPYAVSFKVSAVGAEENELTCFWDWGDGQDEEDIDGTTASHTFATGSYEVKLRAVNRTTGDEAVAPSVVRVTALGRILYVKANNTAPQLPYDNWENAATNLNDAVAIALDGCEIIIAEGEYPVSEEILVAKRLDIHGAGSRDATVFNAVGTGHRIFHLAHANAKVANLTASGASASSGAGIYIGTEGGCASNVLVRNCYTSGYGCRGAGIYVANSANALVDSAVVTNCDIRCEGNGSGGMALAMDGGMTRNCLFTGNRHPASGNQTPVGTVYVAGGELVNCTIAGNECGDCAGVWATGGRVVNCLIGENTTTHENASYAVFACDSTLIDLFDHCMAPIRISRESFEGENFFRKAAAGDYRLATGSAALDKGVREDWMKNATDLLGAIRVVNGKPDLGCYEYQGGGLKLILR